MRPRGRHALAATACVAVGVVAAPGCGGADAGGQTATVATAEPARAFAPLIHLHRDTENYPLSAERFLRNATLKWASDRCIWTQSIAWGPGAVSRNGPGPRLSAARLGGRAPYRERLRGAGRTDCPPIASRRYASDEPTRPYDPGPRPDGLRPGDGFYLDLLTAAHPGTRTSRRDAGQLVLDGIPAYYDREPVRVDGRPAVRLRYWTLYGYSDLLTPDGAAAASHEGGWERIDVVVRRVGPRRWLPLGVVAHHGAGAVKARWADVEAGGPGGSHVVVYAGRDSHAPYLAPGAKRPRAQLDGSPVAAVEPAASACEDCPQWRTWADLRPARAEPWYGFGGGWGLAYDDSDSSGPAGPRPPSADDGAASTGEAAW